MFSRYNYIKIILFLLVLFGSLSVLAQDYDYTQYTAADSIPSNYIYGAVEDDSGYILFSDKIIHNIIYHGGNIINKEADISIDVKVSIPISLIPQERI